MSTLARQQSSDDVRQHIISSLFSRKDEDGTPDETLISFLKVFEEDPQDPNGGLKSRYLMLAVTKMGKVVIHKAKRNNNLSFSRGKTWHLEDMRALEVISPTAFALTMTIRRYQWQTERAKDQLHFLNSIVKVYKTYTKGELPELINFQPPPPSAVLNGAPTMESRQPSSSSMASPPPSRNSELVPPQAFKTQRSGSSSSMASGQSSFYQSSDAMSRGRPSLDDQRTPSAAQLGRSPLADTLIPPVRRPSDVSQVRTPSPQVNGKGHQGSNGVGLGMPGQRKMSSDRLALGDRNGSTASDHQDSGRGMVRRPSGDQVRSTPEADTRERPLSSRSQLKETMQENGPSHQSSRSAEDPPPSEAESTSTPVPLPPPPRSPARLKQPAPTITTTLPSPAMPSAPQVPTPTSATRLNRRASFHPPPLNTAFSREVLLTSRTGLLPGAAGLTIDGDDQQDDAILSNVEEMLEGFEWTAAGGADIGRKKGSADAIEGRLLDELAALDSANIHAFLESDDRIALVLGHIDEALLELDDIDMQISGYRMQLNAVSEDISYIESQNRGLQVQTSNQQALLNEMKQLLQIVEVPPDDLRVLAQESPGSERGVKALERAAASLYKALQAGRDNATAEVAATIARIKEYQETSTQFTKRIMDYLDITFKHQSDTTLSEYRKTSRQTMSLAPHNSMGEYLMMYEGLVLYMKEMDEDRYQRLCSNYMSTISQLHQNEIKDMLINFIASIKASASGEPNEASFATAAGSAAPKASALQKSKTVMGLRAADAPRKDRKGDDNAQRIAELYQKGLTEIINQVLIEEDFISAFLHLTDTESTFADHMELDSYFRRQAARHATNQMSPGMMQLVRSMMDLVFGFVEMEIRNWVEAATEKNIVAIVGIMGVTEKLAMEAEQENTSLFFSQLFDRQLSRQRAVLDAFVNEQIRVIESARATAKKRRGVLFFVRHFPIFVEKIEAQLDEEASELPIRNKVNDIYDRVVNAIFGSITHIAKVDRGELQNAEDKGQLNYHVIVIENMYHLTEDVTQLNTPALSVSLDRAQALYEENMTSYIRTMLRRYFGRIIDFFDGVERLLQTTPATEISLHSTHSRSTLKKVLKDVTAKDMRKAIDALSKRVDKHFYDDDTVSQDPRAVQLVGVVWRELCNKLKSEIARDEGYLKACYPDSGLSLDFGISDIDAACKRAKA
ncbi:exocyst complex component Sec3-domain-containing protein [Naematelia encephala]|uniref:Exocyst complex component Sec3-domain-containing protein n=1 Tax=Naematelia encephala TaxID=71784 RepID=A0A1Y2BHL5_9TREE|nr:exocyst complex component Sec3-domain-containing protein [Naematelia encephala]